jgi:outer membrane protein TolC
LVVTNLYLESIAGASRVDATGAQVVTAEATYKQALDFKENGLVPAIDVLRAQVELQAQQQRLIYFRNEFEKQKLSLERATGIPDGQVLKLTDGVPFAPMPSLTLDDAVGRALGAGRAPGLPEHGGKSAQRGTHPQGDRSPASSIARFHRRLWCAWPKFG